MRSKHQVVKGFSGYPWPYQIRGHDEPSLVQSLWLYRCKVIWEPNWASLKLMRLCENCSSSLTLSWIWFRSLTSWFFFLVLWILSIMRLYRHTNLSYDAFLCEYIDHWLSVKSLRFQLLPLLEFSGSLVFHSSRRCRPSFCKIFDRYYLLTYYTSIL